MTVEKKIKVEIYFGDYLTLPEIFFSEMFEHVEKLENWKFATDTEKGYSYVKAKVTPDEHKHLCEVAELLGCLVIKARRN